MVDLYSLTHLIAIAKHTRNNKVIDDIIKMLHGIIARDSIMAIWLPKNCRSYKHHDNSYMHVISMQKPDI